MLSKVYYYEELLNLYLLSKNNEQKLSVLIAMRNIIEHEEYMQKNKLKHRILEDVRSFDIEKDEEFPYIEYTIQSILEHSNN